MLSKRTISWLLTPLDWLLTSLDWLFATNTQQPTINRNPTLDAAFFSKENNKKSKNTDWKSTVKRILLDISSKELEAFARMRRSDKPELYANASSKLVLYEYIVKFIIEHIRGIFIPNSWVTSNLIQNKKIAWTRTEFDSYFQSVGLYDSRKDFLCDYYKNPHNERSIKQFIMDFQYFDDAMGKDNVRKLVDAFVAGCQRTQDDEMIKKLLSYTYPIYFAEHVTCTVAVMYGTHLIDSDRLKKIKTDLANKLNPEDFIRVVSLKKPFKRRNILLQYLKLNPENEAEIKPALKKIMLGGFLEEFENDPHHTLYDNWLCLSDNATDLIERFSALLSAYESRTNGSSKYLRNLEIITLDYIKCSDLGIDKNTEINPGEYVLSMLINIFNKANISATDFSSSFVADCVGELWYRFDNEEFGIVNSHLTLENIVTIIDNTKKTYEQELNAKNTMRP